MYIWLPVISQQVVFLEKFSSKLKKFHSTAGIYRSTYICVGAVFFCKWPKMYRYVYMAKIAFLGEGWKGWFLKLNFPGHYSLVCGIIEIF